MRAGVRTSGTKGCGGGGRRDDDEARAPGDAQEVLRVGDGADKDAAGLEVPRDVLEHHAHFGLGLERVVHAELHRDDVERALDRVRREDLLDRVLRAGEGERESL